jgi:hypothetical protein
VVITIDPIKPPPILFQQPNQLAAISFHSLPPKQRRELTSVANAFDQGLVKTSSQRQGLCHSRAIACIKVDN